MHKRHRNGHQQPAIFIEKQTPLVFHHSKQNRVLIENHYLYEAIKADLRGFVINRAAKGSEGLCCGLRATSRRFLIACRRLLPAQSAAPQSSSSFLRVVCDTTIWFEIEISNRSFIKLRKFVSSCRLLFLLRFSLTMIVRMCVQLLQLLFFVICA